MEPRPERRALVDGELLAEGQVLESELAVAADEERKEPEHIEQEADHEGRLQDFRARPDEFERAYYNPQAASAELAVLT